MGYKGEERGVFSGKLIDEYVLVCFFFFFNLFSFIGRILNLLQFERERGKGKKLILNEIYCLIKVTNFFLLAMFLKC